MRTIFLLLFFFAQTAILSSQKLLVADNFIDRFWEIDLTNVTATSIFPSSIVGNIENVDIDEINRHIYFSENIHSGSGNHALHRMDFDGSNLTKLISEGFLRSTSLKVSPSLQKIFFTDDYSNFLSCNLDGTDLDTLWFGDFYALYDITIDEVNNLAYIVREGNVAVLDLANPSNGIQLQFSQSQLKDFTDIEYHIESQTFFLIRRGGFFPGSADKYGVYKFTAADTAPTLIYNSGDHEIYGLAINQNENKIYWFNEDTNTMEQSDFDGSNKTNLFTTSDLGLSSIDIGIWEKITFYQDMDTPVKNTTSYNSLALSPNPTSGFVNISIPEFVTDYKIRIFDTTGKTILQSKQDTNFWLNSGVYFIEVTDFKTGRKYLGKQAVL